MKLLEKLKTKPLCNEFHFVMFGIIIFYISYKYPFFYILLRAYLFFIIKKTKLIKIILPCIVILFLSLTIIDNIKIDKEEVVVKIDDVKSNYYICNYNGIKIKIYEKNTKYVPGDYIQYKLEYFDKPIKSYETDFDYDEYLKSNKILAQARALKSEKIRSGVSFKIIKYKLITYLKENLDTNTFKYVNAVVFFNNEIDDDIKESYSNLNLSHILAISGMHIMLLYNILSFLFLKLFHYYKNNIQLVLIFIYVLILGFPIATTRALLFLLIKCFNDKGKIKYTKLDILSISFIIMIFTWPYMAYNNGLILSYLVSFVLIFSQELIKTNKKLLNAYLTFYLIYFTTLPIIINMNNSVNLITLLFSPILSLFIGYILIPIAYISVIFPITNYLTKYMFDFISLFIFNLNKTSININVASINIYFRMLYYFLFILFIISILKRKNIILKLSLYILYLLILININIINPFTKVTFIDVGQGDSCLIELNNNRGNMLIDAYNCFDFVKSTGIKKIDYLILTHSDNDHIEDAKKIIDYYKIKKVYVPLYDNGFSDFNAIYIKNDYLFKLDNIECKVLGPINKYLEKNSNSIVFKIKINSISFLFTGDMTEEEENDIVNRYSNELKSDVLKVGHHGSNTSSSINFLNYVKPKISIISVAENNKYNLPNKEIVERLSRVSSLYLTKDRGNITFYFFNDFYKIITFR